jgi:hypothetical protein
MRERRDDGRRRGGVHCPLSCPKAARVHCPVSASALSGGATAARTPLTGDRRRSAKQNPPPVKTDSTEATETETLPQSKRSWSASARPPPSSPSTPTQLRLSPPMNAVTVTLLSESASAAHFPAELLRVSKISIASLPPRCFSRQPRSPLYFWAINSPALDLCALLRSPRPHPPSPSSPPSPVDCAFNLNFLRPTEGWRRNRQLSPPPPRASSLPCSVLLFPSLPLISLPSPSSVCAASTVLPLSAYSVPSSESSDLYDDGVESSYQDERVGVINGSSSAASDAPTEFSGSISSRMHAAGESGMRDKWFLVAFIAHFIGVHTHTHTHTHTHSHARLSCLSSPLSSPSFPLSLLS